MFRVAPQLRNLSEAEIAEGFRLGEIVFREGVAVPVISGAATASDDFSSGLSANWASSGSAAVTSGAWTSSNTNADARSTWKASVNNFGDAQFSQGTISGSGGTTGDGTGIGVCLSSDESTTGNGTMYRIVCQKAVSNNIELARFDSDAYTPLAHYTYSWVNGSVVRAENDGAGSITIYMDGNLLGVYDDSGNLNGVITGQPGVVYSSTITSPSIDNWSGGDLVVVTTTKAVTVNWSKFPKQRPKNIPVRMP